MYDNTLLHLYLKFHLNIMQVFSAPKSELAILKLANKKWLLVPKIDSQLQTTEKVKALCCEQSLF